MKNFIRKKIKNELKSLSKEDIETNSSKIEQQLTTINDFNKASKIGLYYSIEKEIETKHLIKKLLSQNKEILLPKVNNNDMHFVKINTLDELNPGKYGILEPKSKKESKPDLVILPAIAIDKNGNRIGRGKGFFDKYLNKNPNIKTICLVNNLQVIENINPEKHDKKIDIIISEKKIINTQNNKLLLGTKHAKEIKDKIKLKIKNENINATLAVILVGDNESSQIYVSKKEEECQKIGINFKLIKFSKNVTNETIKDKIKTLNDNKEITGILIQLPLPKHLDTPMLLNTINEIKDVDGLSDKSLENLRLGNEFLPCCTPKGILTLLEKNKINLKDKKIGIIGYGRLVGQPLAAMLKNRNLDFFVCNKDTENTREKSRQADILIAATGVPNLIRQEYVKKDAILIDVGTNKVNGKIIGDAYFDEVSKIASKITPPIGGVGPMTIATLLENVIKAYGAQNKKYYLGIKQNFKKFSEL